MLVRRGKNIPTLSRVLYRVEKDEAVHESNSAKMTQRRDWSLFMGGWHRREMFFLVKILLIQPLKSRNFSLPNLKYQLQNKYPLLAKNFTNRRYHSVVTHNVYHFCDMSLITACAKFHVVSTSTFFGDTICLHTNRKMTKIVTRIDSHIACIDMHA